MSSKRYDDSRQWYAIHTYSGYEEKVAESIRQRINGVDMADKIFDVMAKSLRKQPPGCARWACLCPCTNSKHLHMNVSSCPPT